MMATLRSHGLTFSSSMHQCYMLCFEQATLPDASLAFCHPASHKVIQLSSAVQSILLRPETDSMKHSYERDEKSCYQTKLSDRPIQCSSMPFCACIRFSASWNTTE